MYVSMYVFTFIHTYICTYIHTYAHTYIHIYINAYTHTHSQRRTESQTDGQTDRYYVHIYYDAVNFLDQYTSNENTFKKTSPSSLTLSNKNSNTGKNDGEEVGQDRKLKNLFNEWLHKQIQIKQPLQIADQDTTADHEH